MTGGDGGDASGTFFTTGSAFGGGGGAFSNNGLANGNNNAFGVFNRYPTTAPATSLLSSFGGGNTAFQQQLPFAQQFGQFNRDDEYAQRDAGQDYASVQPLLNGGGGVDRNGGGFGGDVSLLQPSAFDRVVRRG